MKKPRLILPVTLAIALLVGVWAVSTYRGLARDSQGIDDQWRRVETHMRSRYGLIPDLVNTVKSHAAPEERIFTGLADAEARLANAATVDEKVAAAIELESALYPLLIIVENYPELTADMRFKSLMDGLTQAEDGLSVEKMRFNRLAEEFNYRVMRFPTIVMAKIFGFDARGCFQEPFR